jgi:2-iminobutanoate/2-iminopropanoate deaminase
MTSRARLLLTAALLLALAPRSAGAQAREPIGRSTATLTDAIRVGNMVYASGQLGLRDSTLEGQTRLALEATKRVFEAAGTTMDRAVRCTVFLVEASDFQAMNTVYSEFWPQHPPARSTVVVKALVVPRAKVEIECMAVMPTP